MAIPKYYEMYHSFLETLIDGKVHTIAEAKRQVIKNFGLTSEELAEILPSGKQTVFDNRLGWCRTHLKKAGLIESPARAQFVITEIGKEIYKTVPEINDNILFRFPAYVEFRNGDTNNKAVDSKIENKDETPQETLDRVCNQLNKELANDILAEVMKMDPYKFEMLVVELLVKMGYGKMQYESRATKKSGDEGIDGIVTADKLGFDSIYIQAKRFKERGTVGRPEIQKFVGALSGQGAQKGIFITSSKFSKEAVEFAQKNLNCKIILVDGKRLAELMVEYELGVSTEYVYKVKKIDSDYFVEG